MKMNKMPRLNGTRSGSRFVWVLLLVSGLGGLGSARGGQVDRWLADDLAGLNEGAAWTLRVERSSQSCSLFLCRLLGY